LLSKYEIEVYVGVITNYNKKTALCHCIM